MKNVKIGDYLVNVNAMKEYEAHTNPQSTMYFLNELSLVYQYASEHQLDHGYPEIALSYRKKSDEIYEQLKKLGAYGI